MSKLLVTSLSAIVLALGVTGALADQASSGMMQNGSQAQPPTQTERPAWGMAGPMAGGYGRMGQGWMDRQGRGPNSMGFGMMGAGMMGGGMMGAGMMGPDMMVVMMDTNGDGALSLDEFQAMHARMFKYLDANHDGKLTTDELNAFHRGREGEQSGK